MNESNQYKSSKRHSYLVLWAPQMHQEKGRRRSSAGTTLITALLTTKTNTKRLSCLSFSALPRKAGYFHTKGRNTMQTRRSRLSTLWNRARTSHAVFCTSSVLYYLLLTNYVANKFAFISRNRYATSSNSGDTLPRWFYYVFGLPFTFKLGLDGSATIQNFLAFNKEEKNMITEIWADVHGETILSKALGEGLSLT